MGSLSSTLKRKMLRLPLSKSHLCYGDGRAAPRTYRNDAPTQWTIGQGGNRNTTRSLAVEQEQDTVALRPS